MSDHAPEHVCSEPCLLDTHHFLLKRLHSLSGIVPVGVFAIAHLFTNFQMIRGGGHFQHEVNFIHSLPGLLFIEITLWLSIGFHAVLGVVYIRQGKVNVKHYSYPENIRYTLQRLTGVLALIFIFVHIATLRWRWSFFGWFTPFYAEGPNGEPLASATTAAALQSHWLVVVLYFIGAMSVVYHWANGLWTAAITWGVTLSVTAQKRWAYICGAMGLLLTVFTIGAIVGALQYHVTEQEKQVIQMQTQAPVSAVEAPHH